MKMGKSGKKKNNQNHKSSFDKAIAEGFSNSCDSSFLETPSYKPKSTMINKKFYPTVSVCTPTFNRRPFIKMMFECFHNQTYPKSCIEWIIVDDGTDPIKDLVESSGIEQIKYYRIEEKMPLGKKRNFMHTKCTGNIIVYMDDDDYYPPERISHSVDTLIENKDALCAGASEIYIYFKHISQMIQCGPYNKNHATAGTFAFKAELLKQTKYDDEAALAEEKAFLKNYTIPFVQLDPLKTILVFSHNHNTFDKKKMLENMHPDFCKESAKQISAFIKGKNTDSIKKFFLEEIDDLLANYSFGDPSNKPDVLENIKKLEKERQVLNTQNTAGPPKIIMNQPDGSQVELNTQDLINIINRQQEQIQNLMRENENLKRNLGESTITFS